MADEESSLLVEQQYAAAIQLIYDSFEQISKHHDVRRAMHFVVLLRGRRPAATKIFTNAVNVSDAWRGPEWVRVQGNDGVRSIHAEARAAQQTFVPDRHQSRRAKRRAQRSAVAKADGMLVCRIIDSSSTDLASRLRFSLPCAHCTRILSKCQFSFIVYSTGEPHEPWKKVSIAQLLNDERVQPVVRLRPVN